jgi:hypothetical protein
MTTKTTNTLKESLSICYATRGQQREREINAAEWAEMLRSGKYEQAVVRLRKAVALCGNRQEGELVGVPALPDVRVCAGDDYRGVVVLTLPVDEGGSWQQLRKSVTLLPQTLLAFRGSSGRTLKVVCRATLPDGSLPEKGNDSRLFRQHALALAARFYEGQTGIRAQMGDGGRRCRMSADPETYYNEHATGFVLEQPTESLAMSLRRRTAASVLLPSDSLPGYDERKMQMARFQFCYAEVLAQNHQEIDIMLEELARQTMKNGLEAEFCLRRLMHMSQFQGYEVLVRRTFRNVYGMCYQRPQLLEREKDAVPYFTLHMELLKQFMKERYLLRRNLISDGVEYMQRGEIVADWQPLDRHALATITMEALSEGIEAWDKDIKRYVDSTWVQDYDPIVEFLSQLPRWDGQDHIAAMAQRVPTNNEHWAHDFAVWLRAMVAQWLGRNGQYGNAMVPLLIGAQGDGKSTFCRRLLPDELADYYTDRIDFANRNVAERMLTRFCLINIDEYDSLSHQQGAFLKHVLQKADVKTRKLYDSQILNRQRYATFIATTNDPTPLTDSTGSRRFMCLQLTGRIDNESPINHPQLYAQVKAELDAGLPSWFDHEREQRIQQQNINFQLHDSMEEIFCEMFRKPADKEEEMLMSAAQILSAMKKRYVSVKTDNCWVQRLSKMLVRKQFERHHTNSKNLFRVSLVEGK